VTASRLSKTKQTIFDVVMCWAVPAVCMALRTSFWYYFAAITNFLP
jgi:hypothetical protein